MSLMDYFKYQVSLFLMPRSRRRHHSRSKSRSRSHSQDKEREIKRRKIEIYDSPSSNKRSVSSEHEDVAQNNTVDDLPVETKVESTVDGSEASSSKTVIKKIVEKLVCESPENPADDNGHKILEVINVDDEDENLKFDSKEDSKINIESTPKRELRTKKKFTCTSTNDGTEASSSKNVDKNIVEKLVCESQENPTNDPGDKILKVINLDGEDENVKLDSKNDSKINIESMPKRELRTKESLTFTSKTVISPKQLQRKLESERMRQEKQKEKEDRERQKQQEREDREKQKEAEKERVKQEKLKLLEAKMKEKMEKHEQKQKEVEIKQKEKEMKEEMKKKEKELKRQDKEKKEEARKKEKEEKEREKNKEKLKQEEQKQKAAAAFVNFFVPKKVQDNSDDKKSEEQVSSLFMPFEVKSDMKLPPLRRDSLHDEEKSSLEQQIRSPDPDCSFLKDLKCGKLIRTCSKTWPFEDSLDDNEVTIVEDVDLGETICEDNPKSSRLRAKYLKFHENRRPAYYGSWRKKSKCITGRRPFKHDKVVFDYEVDSDDDWEEEEQGESLENASDDDKENEVENEDYEVDNEFFVPHGHLSDDEIDDEELAKLSPESQKQKLKLLKDEFDQDHLSKTHKIKPRAIGCIWYNKDGKNVDKAIDRYLQPLAMITNGRIVIGKRTCNLTIAHRKKSVQLKDLPIELIPVLIKLVHGNTSKKKTIIEDFFTYLCNNDLTTDVPKSHVSKHISHMAQWTKSTEFDKWCWVVNEDVVKKEDNALPKSS